MSQRSFIWIACLILAAALSALWGQLPQLDSSPLLRVGLFAGLGLLCFPLALLLPDLNRKHSIMVIGMAAVILRLFLLPAPVSDDVNRYLWEGKLVLAGENPFEAPADDPVWASHRDDHWELMNHKDRPTAYPPGVQWIMAGAVALSYHPVSMKALTLLGDLFTLALLIKLLALGRQPLRWAGFYAFNPIVLIAFAAEAHFDSLMIAALMGMLLADSLRRPHWTWFLFGLAVQIKLICVILGPLILKRENARGLWALGLVLVLPTLPFVGAVDGWWNGVTTFGGGGSFNGPLLTFFSLMGLALPQARLLCIVCFAAICFGVWLNRIKGSSLIRSSFTLLGGLLVCSPIVHFWYLAWIIPLVALMPSFGWMTASVTMAGYFLAWRTQDLHGWWGYEHSTAAWIWLPVGLAFALQNRQWLPRLRTCWGSRKPITPGRSLGIVIPTLNPDDRLTDLVRQLHESCDAPIVIADSSPDAPKLSEQPSKWIKAPLGRGNQIAAGIAELSEGWVLITHADATPPEDWHSSLIDAIDRHPKASMLVFGQRFDPPAKGTAIIEGLNELRVIFGGVAFGDQTMVIRREALERIGGFPAQPLMEDVEVSLRLQAEGPIVYLGKEWHVCARKWQSGFGQRFALVIRLMTTYQIARLRGRDHSRRYSEALYHEYYRST